MKDFIFVSEKIIEADLWDIWNVVTAPKNWVGMHPQTVSVSDNTGVLDLSKTLEFGAVFQETTEARLVITLTQYWTWVCDQVKPGKVFRFSGNTHNGLLGKIRYDFEEIDKGVNFLRTFTLKPDNIFQSAALELLTTKMQCAGNEYLENIERHLNACYRQSFVD